MGYKILTSNSASGLNTKVNDYLEGENQNLIKPWKLKGSHHVVTTLSLDKYSGSQHTRTIYTQEYSQTIIQE